MLKSDRVAHEILVTAQRPNFPFPLDLTVTGTSPGIAFT